MIDGQDRVEDLKACAKQHERKSAEFEVELGKVQKTIADLKNHEKVIRE